MANIPSYAERTDILRQTQEICKTKGNYAKKKFPTYESFIRYFANKYRGMKDSIFSCVKNIKNLINEYLKWAQNGLEVKTEFMLRWFKTYLNLVLKAAKHGIKMAETFVNRVLRRRRFKEGIGSFIGGGVVAGVVGYSLAATAFGGIMLGIVVSVIGMSISWWMRVTNRVDLELRSKPKLLDRTKNMYNSTFNSDDDFPDELLPPEPEVPNITMTFINESSSKKLREDPLTIGLGVLFLLFLKASIASTYNQEMEQKARVMKSAIPSPASLAFIGLVLFFAANSAAFLPAVA